MRVVLVLHLIRWKGDVVQFLNQSERSNAHLTKSRILVRISIEHRQTQIKLITRQSAQKKISVRANGNLRKN